MLLSNRRETPKQKNMETNSTAVANLQLESSKSDRDFVLYVVDTYIEKHFEESSNVYLEKEFIAEDAWKHLLKKAHKYVPGEASFKTWAKIVGNDFKEKHHKVWAPNIISNGKCIEEEIADKYITDTLIEKEYSKIALDGWTSRKIPQLLSTVFHCLVTEEMWSILKEFKNPKIDFKILQNMVTRKIKEVKKDLF